MSEKVPSQNKPNTGIMYSHTFKHFVCIKGFAFFIYSQFSNCSTTLRKNHIHLSATFLKKILPREKFVMLCKIVLKIFFILIISLLANASLKDFGHCQVLNFDGTCLDEKIQGKVLPKCKFLKHDGTCMDVQNSVSVNRVPVRAFVSHYSLNT